MTKNTSSHRERLETCLSGNQPDRLPVALWRHFPVDDQSPDGLASATTTFQNTYNFDLIKISPSSSFCLKDWGSEDCWSGAPEGTRDYKKVVIQDPDDWSRLPNIDPTKGHLGNQLKCIRLLVEEFSPHTPMIQTIFSPLAQAKNLVGQDNFLTHLRKYPDALHAGLERIAQTTIKFIEEVKKTGIDGVFYAVQHAQYGILSESEFETFGKQYDLMVLEPAQDLWLNMIHLHGENIMFDKVVDYPGAILNWHDRHTPPTLAEAQKSFGGVVCGGLRRWETMVLGTPEDVHKEASEAVRATGGKRFILGTGCVLPIIAPHGNINAALSVS